MEIVFFVEGIQQLRACTWFGLGGPKGYLWSWVVGETSPVGRVARLVWDWLSFRTWEGLLAAGKSKEKRQARTATKVDLLATYRYFPACMLSFLPW